MKRFLRVLAVFAFLTFASDCNGRSNPSYTEMKAEINRRHGKQFCACGKSVGWTDTPDDVHLPAGACGEGCRARKMDDDRPRRWY